MEKQTFFQEYDKKCKLYTEFIDNMETLIKFLLNQYQILVHSVSSRLKEKQSAEEKLSLQGRNIEKLNDMRDICGLRIITYYPDQVDTISSMILNEFNVDHKHSTDKRKTIDPDRFGYLSVHYIVKLSTDRLKLTEYRRFSDCQAEIQIRSILQHAWAEIEHNLGYKTKEAVPREIRRRFSRLAGILEIADDEFVNVREELYRYENIIAQEIANVPDKVKVDETTLKVYLKHSPLVQKVNSKIERATHNILVKEEPTPDLHRRLRYLGLKKIADVNEALTTYQQKVVRFAKILVAPVGESGEGYWSYDTCLFYLPYAILASRGSIDEIRLFVNRFIGKEDNEHFCQLILKV